MKNKFKTSETFQSLEGKIISSTKSVVACDGNKEALGHPRVFLTLKINDITTCPYCSQQFTYIGK